MSRPQKDPLMPHMPKVLPTIHLVRHAQGFHNISTANEAVRDPDLTPTGEHQCSDLRAAFSSHDKLAKLVSSPMRRTIHTCNLAFGGPGQLYPIILLDTLQEVSASPCDTGSGSESLLEEYGYNIDVEHLRGGWTDKTRGGPFEPSLAAVTARAREARLALLDIAEHADGDVVVVTHGGFLHFLTDDWEGIPADGSTAWENCMYRSYAFDECPDDEDDVRLVETRESRRRRNAPETSLTYKERRELKAAAQARIAPYLKMT
ncbi:hypothetical protein E4U42_006325 [Claviceps africana]|uniref:Phosphoglycerate mutase family protein n=1 Tax=Claviceps africana TaxID=83212 RepID=A0A8K0J352_9HYPO|nr:hypothetical protein E4U42_006325 [Claviceps africana]